MKFYRYFYDIKEPFAKITDINSSDCKDYLDLILEKSLASKTYNENYINQRLLTEKKMREIFIRKGGRPQLKHPHYLVLENCDNWFYNIKNFFGSIVIDSSLFLEDVVSFTYGDSMPTFDDTFFDGKEYRKNLYTLNEIKDLINKYSLPQLWNQNCKYGIENYIEVQVWSDNIISKYNLFNTKDIYTTLDLFYDSAIEGNKFLKTVIDTFPKQMSLKEAKQILEKQNYKYIWTMFNIFKNIYLPDKMHGIEHAFRTAIYMLMIGVMKKVNKDYLESMIIVAFAHDIGRKYSSNQDHGFIGANILEKYLNASECNVEIIKKAITAHSIEDYNLYMDINCKNSKEIQLIKWLKDVDTLDYIRFGIKEYNPNFIRTEEARKLIKLAAELNLYMESYPKDDYKILRWDDKNEFNS